MHVEEIVGSILICPKAAPEPRWKEVAKNQRGKASASVDHGDFGLDFCLQNSVFSDQS